MLERMDTLLTDPRKRREYALTEIIMAAVVMFLFREGSRHAFNSDRRQETFFKNYGRLFGLRFPHMDTVEDVMRLLHCDELETLKASLVSALIEKKVFHRFKFLGKRFMVAVDGTGVTSYDHKHCEHCLHKTSATGTITYFHHVLEAKLVTSNGMAISLCSEWIANDPENGFDKQDCEHKAFRRLAVKLKKLFPRLPICIAADGLYPNQHFFAICQQNDWDFIVTLKDGNLPSLQQEIELLKPLHTAQGTERIVTQKNIRTTQTYRWINHLEHKGTTLHWVECVETVARTTVAKQESAVSVSRFVHITNVEMVRETVCRVSEGGRLRWKIENEGFNTQKNSGYNMDHKYSRVSFQALKNYYQCLQLAHLINQLVEKSEALASLISDSPGIGYLWQKVLGGFLIWIDLDEGELAAIGAKRWQIRLSD